MRAFFLAAVFLAVFSGKAAAASFCVVGMGIPPQCLYDDIGSCMAAATPPNSFCAVSPTARLYYYGSSRFCAVQSDRVAQCVFGDRTQCYRAVFRDKTVCVDREERPDDISPFRYDQRIGN
ncbi:MAG: hypothetical protein KGL10_06020 [Alphaproteobacteria bacterium]|nr:hypothetical protein [Alphaproteobacteria bacterium]MDE2336850.1 hypothetical protein [Alphaproteobacteria bacterium]